MTSTHKKILLATLVVASLLRLTVLSRGDTLGDEVGYGFRSIGMMDFDEAEKQTTPLEWFDPYIPSWTSWSFHDHPPLVFLLQHWSINIFGETNFGLRLPSAFAGIASVWLIYAIGTMLFSIEAGLASSALYAVTVNAVYVSRIGIQESIVIFFILLTTYCVLRALQRDTWFIYSGMALGLGLLAKYTTSVIAPILALYVASTKPRMLLNKKMWIGIVLAGIVFAPVIYYNYRMYQSVGHFDFQLSFIFHQNPDVWEVAPGKEIGTIQDRLHNFLPSLWESNSWVLLVAFLLSVVTYLYGLGTRGKELLYTYRFFLFSFPFLLLLILFIGPSYRFLSPFSAFMVLAVGASITRLHSAYPTYTRTWTIAALLIIGCEITYTVNSTIAYYPYGPKTWAYAHIRDENYNWGYNALAAYLEEELAGKMPAIAFEAKYHFIETIHESAISRAQKDRLTPYPAIIVYDRNILNMPQLWVLDRLQIYHAWPVIPTEEYVRVLIEKGSDYFSKAGVKIMYVIIPTEHIPQKPSDQQTPLGKQLENELLAKNISPNLLQNQRGEVVFKIYKFPI